MVSRYLICLFCLNTDRNLGTGRHLLWKKNAMTTNKTAKESSKKCNPPSE